jgi:hypothetical protein
MKSILLSFARAGSKQYISFFLLVIGFKGLSNITLGFRTHMRIYFEHLEGF